MNAFLSTWYGTLLFIAAIVFVYLLIGAYVGGRLDDWDGEAPDDAVPNIVWGCLFWPIILVFLGVMTAGEYPYKLGRSYTARKNKRLGTQEALHGTVLPRQ